MFSKKSEVHPKAPATNQDRRKPMATRSSNGGTTFSVLGPDISVKGNIETRTDLHVNGSVEGDIACSALIQGETSTIDGGIEAKSARLAGRVTGSIKVGELVILKSARIDGDVSYDTLTIEQGAQVEGRLSPRGEASAARPARAAAVADQPQGEPNLALAG